MTRNQDIRKWITKNRDSGMENLTQTENTDQDNDEASEDTNTALCKKKPQDRLHFTMFQVMVLERSKEKIKRKSKVRPSTKSQVTASDKLKQYIQTGIHRKTRRNRRKTSVVPVEQGRKHESQTLPTCQIENMNNDGKAQLKQECHGTGQEQDRDRKNMNGGG